MTNLDVNRSINFVSLDTHPANNALVITYEIVASIIDKDNKNEIARRNKRDQMQINVTALDRLTANDLKENKLTVDIQALSNEIISKCPLLSSSTNKNDEIEDIQLHLLYLVGRRQSQLLLQQQNNEFSYQINLPSQESDKNKQSIARPPSSASIRLRSANQHNSRHNQAISSACGRYQQRFGANNNSATRQRRLLSHRERGDLLSQQTDVYNYLNTKRMSSWNNNDVSDLFIDEFDEYLFEKIEQLAEQQSQLFILKKQAELEEVENYLEGLYGDSFEKLHSLVKIRELIREDANLGILGSNRLLICAMLRTLRDLDNKKRKEYSLLSELIFYCLLRLTIYDDIYMKVFGFSNNRPCDNKKSHQIMIDNNTDSSIDIIKLITDLLSDSVSRNLKDLSSTLDNYYYINSLLIMIINRFSNNEGDGSSINNLSNYIVEQKILIHQKQHEKKILDSLIELFCLETKFLTKDILLITRPEKLILTLNRIIIILKQLSIFKEFVIQLRLLKNKKLLIFVESIVILLNTLQLTRPGSGGAGAQNESASKFNQIVTDKLILNDLYELEIIIFEFINNIIFDSKIKIKLIRKNLLKCVLRNLVVFLAKSNIFNNYDKSTVLLTPFKCLYELCCHSMIKLELYKSKIIMKCLLEYLLSATMELKSNFDLLLNLNESSSLIDNEFRGKFTKRDNKDDDDDSFEQILLKPQQASHYVLAIWLNLTSQNDSPIYGLDLELKELICDYIELSINSIQIYTTLISNKSLYYRRMRRTRTSRFMKQEDQYELMLYLHLKILRNISQFSVFKDILDNNNNNNFLTSTTLLNWLKQLNESTNKLMVKEINTGDKMTIPMTVECLASLGNFISNINLIDGENTTNCLLELFPENLIQNLFIKSIQDYNAENDDLLLVSIIFLGILAKKIEICKQKKSNDININLNIIKATNHIIDSRFTDNVMLINTLYTLIQLTNHSQFLRDISSGDSISVEFGKENILTYLVEKLINLITNGNNKIIKLSVLLLIRFCQLEEQRSIDESIIMRKRFVLYNNKWLNAINASRDDNIECGDNYPINNTTDIDDEDYQNSNNDNNVEHVSKRGTLFARDDLNQLHTLDELKYKQTVASDSESNYQNNELNSIDNDEDDIISDDDDDESSTVDEPDLNVIDANSMTKHLTSRRKFRSELMRK